MQIFDFDFYQLDENKIKVGDHFLLDLYANEIWEVIRTKNKYYNKKRRAWFNFVELRFVCNSKKFGNPNGYWDIKLKELIKEVKTK